MHYVGGYLDDKNSPSRKLFDLLSDGKLEWAKLDEKYDVMFNAKTGERLCMTGDPAINRKTLLSHFSYTKLDGHALDRYESVRQFLSMWPLFSPIYHYFSGMSMGERCGNNCFHAQGTTAIRVKDNLALVFTFLPSLLFRQNNGCYEE